MFTNLHKPWRNKVFILGNAFFMPLDFPPRYVKFWGTNQMLFFGGGGRVDKEERMLKLQHHGETRLQDSAFYRLFQIFFQFLQWRMNEELYPGCYQMRPLL